jgi:hypothetical protein
MECPGYMRVSDYCTGSADFLPAPNYSVALGQTATANIVVSLYCKNERTVDFFILFDCFGR